MKINFNNIVALTFAGISILVLYALVDMHSQMSHNMVETVRDRYESQR